MHSLESSLTTKGLKILQHIFIFDFFSHENMHLPFNEGYIRVLKANYPNAHLHFYCCEGHISKLASALTDFDNISFLQCSSLSALSNGRVHNPLFGFWGVIKALNFVQSEVKRESGSYAIAFSGFNGMLLRGLKSLKINGVTPPIHCILHNDLAANFDWRSRNPMVRCFDLISTLKLKLSNIQIVTLELGIREAMLAHFPHLSNNIQTLEHPILASECSSLSKNENDTETLINIGFVGHCSENKGFDTFVQMANKYSSRKVRFHAIGLMEKGQNESLLKPLARIPSLKSVPRKEYVDAINDMDMICLPVSKTYEFVASGSVLDAFTSLKPLILVRNKSYSELEAKYGSFGVMYESREDLLENFDKALLHYREFRGNWVENILKLQHSRIANNISYSFEQ